jgi:hypothetical protein
MSDDLTNREKLLVLTAALFAVRVFRAAPPVHYQMVNDATRLQLEEIERLEREADAKRAALDAAAIMAAVEKVPT